MNTKKLKNLWSALAALWTKTTTEQPETKKGVDRFQKGGIVSSENMGLYNEGEAVVRKATLDVKEVCANCLSAAAAILGGAYDEGLVTKEQTGIEYIFKIAGEMHEKNFLGIAKHLGGVEVLVMMLEEFEMQEQYETCTLIRDSIKRYTQEIK